MKQSILVIDDEPSTRYLLRILLESVGFAVQEADFGLDALNKINETQPDVMIFDVMQKDGSGFAVCKPTDGHKTAVLPIVMLTAKTQWNVFTEIVRGIDIMESTQRQIWLQQLLGYPTPRYVHIPVITHDDGDKLSKLTGAPGIGLDEVRSTLVGALDALRLGPPAELTSASVPEIWAWAAANWKLEPLQGLASIPIGQIDGYPLTETPSMQ